MEAVDVRVLDSTTPSATYDRGLPRVDNQRLSAERKRTSARARLAGDPV